MKSIPAIPTRYGGLQFRSRLEAKWAAFFDTLGWDYEYEPMDKLGWIPDFLLKLHTPVLIEVKPAVMVEDLWAYTDKIDAADSGSEVLLVGVTCLQRGDDGGVCIGLLRDDVNVWSKAEAFRCDHGHGLGFSHAENSYHCRVCGMNDGGGHRHPISDDYRADIERGWRSAANMTQWKRA